jgi:hypothetical protein
MENCLERISSASNVAGGVQSAVQSTVQSAVLVRGKPLWSGGPGVVELEDGPEKDSSGSGKAHSKIEQTYEMDLIDPGMKYVKPPKNWLKRWWSPDPRSAPDMRDAPRESLPGLAAYYWTGGAPKAHSIKDISTSGLYVVTEERWYPGTLILMTLQTTADGEENFENAISVHCRAVRWGNDGVGLQFIPQDTPAAHSGLNPLENGANGRELELFLERLRRGSG